MTTCNQKYSVVDYYFNEMSVSQKDQFEKHLKKCKECAQYLAKFSATAPLIESLKREDPDKALLKAYRTQLKQQFEMSESLNNKLNRLFQLWFVRPTIKIRLAEAVVLILIGLFIGRSTFWNNSPPVEYVDLNNNIYQLNAAEILLDNYLQETEMILLDVANLNPSEDVQLLTNLKQIAIHRKLLQKTLLCREHAQEINDQQLLQLINEIEPILLELCNVQLETFDETLEAIKYQIEDSYLLLAIKNISERKI